MRCPICNTENHVAFSATVITKYAVSYFSCGNCGFVHTQEPYWLEEVYKEAHNDEDTGSLQRNLFLSKIVPSVIFSFFNPHGRFLDFGGGHGVFCRLMRDQGFDYFWKDAYAKNIFSRGFELSEHNGPVEMVTAIECFEHFPRPVEEIQSMLATSANIFFTTDLLPSPVPGAGQWYYYAPTHGQHISFYSLKTLSFLAAHFGLNVYSNGSNIHLFTKKKLTDSKFKRALKTGFLVRQKIRMMMKSRTKQDEELIIARKKQGGKVTK
ncbi:MAG TPA: class I SAM-dependent methyltransferase [Chitinivibrionales bacterium]|nr:class I SAM-dependent methyltransferase [Chitinivibrionales bacterium]